MAQEQVVAKSEMICKQVLASIEYKVAETILGYYPLGNEVNCLSVLKQALTDGKRVVLPRTGQNCQMDFYEIQSMDDVEEGNFHVMEPKMACKKFLPDICEAGNAVVQANDYALVLVPGLVFDVSGNRYGYGKGYYDRYFARFPQLKRMGLSYSQQLSEGKLECLDTDVKMHVIMTENGTIELR